MEAWREARYARLREPMSWLTLAGLEWVREGDNALGTAPEAALRLPAGPAIAGRLVRHGTSVRAHAEPGTGLLHGGREVDGLVLVADVDAPDGEGPTLLELGPLRMCTIRRGDRIGLRVWDTASPALDAFDGIPHFPVDPTWRVEGRVDPPATDETIDVPDVLGEVTPEPLAGTVAFDAAGRTHRLRALDGGDGRLWLIFADETTGAETYGGGRYLYTDPVGDNGRVVVDFNRAYNPPCVFSPYATCPLPPPENRLPIRIEAGERAVSGTRGRPHGRGRVR